MVVDASAVVSMLKGEITAPLIRGALTNAAELAMASVTLTEVALIALKLGKSADESAAYIVELGIEIVPVDEALAVEAAEARHRFPIRFGDAFVYALSKARDLPVLTLDAEFRKTDVLLVPFS